MYKSGNDVLIDKWASKNNTILQSRMLSWSYGNKQLGIKTIFTIDNHKRHLSACKIINQKKINWDIIFGVCPTVRDNTCP